MIISIHQQNNQQLRHNLEVAIDFLLDYQWTGIDDWCVEECGGCKHHGHFRSCTLGKFIQECGLEVKWDTK